jgi:hypothetical protein
MARKPTRSPARPRVSLPLTGTVICTSAQLDFSSKLALDYSTEWLRRELGVKVPASGVIRQALLDYAHRLANSGDSANLALLAQRACTSAIPSSEDQTEAQLRLVATPPDEPLPPFAHVVSGPAAASRTEAINARVDELVNTIVTKTRWGRLKRVKLTEQEAQR